VGALVSGIAMKVAWILALLVGGAALAAQPTRKPSDADRGRDLYQRHCFACHGAGARGDGPASRALVHPPGDLQGKVEADAATIQVVLKGKGAMPSYDQTLTSEDAKRTLLHMKGLTDAPAKPPAVEPAAPPEEEEDPPEEGPR
jgi:mono/diheme cytochrome c family protein